jgi:hypothetical protein
VSFPQFLSSTKHNITTVFCLDKLFWCKITYRFVIHRKVKINLPVGSLIIYFLTGVRHALWDERFSEGMLLIQSVSK